MPAKKKHSDSPAIDDFELLVDSIVQIHHQAQDFATKAVNVGLTLRNWLIGHRIVEFEQNGKDRAAYGERLLPQLAKRLASAGLKRVDMRELRRFRLLYTTYPQIREAVTPELLARAGAKPLSSFTHQLPATSSLGSRKAHRRTCHAVVAKREGGQPIQHPKSQIQNLFCYPPKPFIRHE
jgi:hypothetical protein